MDIGAEQPGTYYVAIVPVLGRDAGGDVVQNLVSITGGPDVFGLVFEPFSEDQYTFRVSRTTLQPSSAGGVAPLARALEKVEPTYNRDSNIVTIPQVRVGGRVFRAELQVKPWNGKGPIEFEMDLDDYHRVLTPVQVDQ